MSFIQFFGSAHQVTPHFHALVPDGVFMPEEGKVRFEALGPPTQCEVERLLDVFACCRCGGQTWLQIGPRVKLRGPFRSL